MLIVLGELVMTYMFVTYRKYGYNDGREQHESCGFCYNTYYTKAIVFHPDWEQGINGTSRVRDMTM